MRRTTTFAATAVLVVATACARDSLSATEDGPAGTSTSAGDPGTTTSADPVTSTTSTTSSPGSTTGEPEVGTEGECVGLPAGVACDEPPPDFEPHECDPYTQEGCGEGEKCTPWNAESNSWDSLRCSTVAPNPVGIGEICHAELGPFSGLDDCEAGSVCWRVDPATNMGRCIELCKCGPETPTCPSGGAVCVLMGEVAPLCLPVCNPLDTDCPDSEVCLPGRGTDGRHFTCVPSFEQRPVGSPCSLDNLCAPGLICASRVCTALCDLATPSCPGEGETCIPYHAEGPPGPCYENLGICSAR